MYAEVRLESYPYFWKAGHDLIEVRVTIGQQDRSSTATAIIADVSGQVAADLIKHSLESGGIAALPQPVTTLPTGGAAGSGLPMVAGETAKTDGARMPTGAVSATELTPEEKAFLDLLAYTEGTTLNSTQNGYDTNIGYAHKTKNYTNHPYLSGEWDALAAGQPSDASGRYQFLSNTWSGLGMPDFSPASQDRAAIKLIEGRGALADVRAGNLEAAIAKTNLEWASLPGSPYGQPTVDLATCRQIYNERLAYYRGTAGTAVNDKQTPPTPLGNTGIPTTDPLVPAEATFKGKKILVTIGKETFEVFHQRTRHTNDGRTEISGQGIRWVMGRRKRNRTERDLSLKQLAEKVAKEHKVELDWKADIDPEYSFIDQTGMSDYQLLSREVERAGLFMSEEGGKLTVKSLRDIRDIQLVLKPGNNLIAYDISDVALDGNQVDQSPTALRQDENKLELDPVSGEFKSVTPDVDPNKSTSVTGQAAKTPTGTLKPGQDGTVKQNRARYKRVKGLPSKFTIPLSDDSLTIRPLDAVRTLGLPGALSRIWVVDAVTHSLPNMTTVLDCYSPVEVLDLTPQVAAAGTPTAANVPPGQYRWAVSGFPVTSLVNPARRNPVSGVVRPHKGTDIGCPTGTPVVASNNGIVTHAGWIEGYGITVIIKHPDGLETLYAHLDSASARVGEQVTGGQQIAVSGSTGVGTGPHLHLEFLRGSQYLYPREVGLQDVQVGDMV